MSAWKDMLNAIKGSLRVKNDEELLESRDKESLKEHSENYDNILSYYTKYVDETLRSKRIMKIAFFWLSFAIMILCISSVISLIIIALVFSQNQDFDFSKYIIPYSTAIVSFLTVFIVIPKIIAKYLFNNNEEVIMQNIVSSIQEYDKYIRSNLQDYLKDSDVKGSENDLTQHCVAPIGIKKVAPIKKNSKIIPQVRSQDKEN